jgi:hypothetical protein
MGITLALTINSSPIQILRLGDYLNHDNTTLPLILERAELPHLTELHISIPIAMTDVVMFLIRHPTIKTLSIPNMLGWILPPEFSGCTCPQLTKLAASSEFVHCVAAPDRTPALHTVHIQEIINSNCVASSCCYIIVPHCPSLLSVHGRSMEIGNVLSVLVLPHITYLTVFLRYDIIEFLPKWITVLFPPLYCMKSMMNEFGCRNNSRSCARGGSLI